MMIGSLPGKPDNGFSLFTILFIIFGVIFVAMLVFVLLMFFSPKVRGKMMSKQVKATKYMVDESKDDISYVSKNMADATKEGTEITARAIRKGFTDSSKTQSCYCKHCGAEIDTDSKFCKSCGKEL